MRWLNFAILVFILLVLQVGVVNKPLGLGPQHVIPNLLLIAMVLIAFCGPQEDVLLAGWFLGLTYDLTSGGTLGVYALGFGVTAMTIVQIREFFYGESSITLMVLVFLSGFLIEQFALVIDIWKDSRLDWSQYGSLTMGIFFSALFSAGLTPLAKGAMNKIRRWMGLPTQRGYRRR